MTLSPRDFAAALVGLRPPAAAAKSQSPAFSVTRQEPTQIPRGAVQTSGASSLGVSDAFGHFWKQRWCRLRDSNPRPTVYKTVALPTELNRRSGGHGLS